MANFRPKLGSINDMKKVTNFYKSIVTTPKIFYVLNNDMYTFAFSISPKQIGIPLFGQLASMLRRKHHLKNKRIWFNLTNPIKRCGARTLPKATIEISGEICS